MDRVGTGSVRGRGPWRAGLRILRHEWEGVVVASWRELRRRGLAGVAVALVAAVAVIGLHEYQQTDTGADVVGMLSEVRADQPVLVSLLRTPVALFVPAVDLPAWGGLPRLILAFALAELLFGRARTLLVAYAVTLSGTMGARVLIALGPDRLGLPAEVARDVDTGASAAVVGLFAFVAVARRAPVLFLATVVPTVLGSVAKPNLAGREHLIAVAFALALAAAFAWRDRRREQGASDGTAGASAGASTAIQSKIL